MSKGLPARQARHGERARDSAGLEGARGAGAGPRGGFLDGALPRPGARGLLHVPWPRGAGV
ncbi:RENBP isoform 5 [Pan troglodytes]|uniref:Renin binding protein n=2 Tax=Homininae TaxID=207598 RepID=F8WE83_HUMAN|nr:renin binding protein [Homo sapiens]KAI4001530.1 renin binding protein [Homo sapiens]PNI11517.1 RENBP isoform 5 [Pan troglodytes]